MVRVVRATLAGWVHCARGILPKQKSENRNDGSGKALSREILKRECSRLLHVALGAAPLREDSNRGNQLFFPRLSVRSEGQCNQLCCQVQSQIGGEQRPLVPRFAGELWSFSAVAPSEWGSLPQESFWNAVPKLGRFLNFVCVEGRATPSLTDHLGIDSN